jgi:pimeloyl-[acyl-carrier protein] synthase
VALIAGIDLLRGILIQTKISVCSLGTSSRMFNLNKYVIFDSSDSEFIHNPYPTYKILRDHDPVHQTASGFWVLSRYEDVAAGLKDPRLSNRPAAFALVNRRNSDRYMAAKVANGLIAFLDPPEHRGPRRLIATTCNAFFRGKEGFAGDVADELLGRLRHKPEIEFVQDFSIPFATTCISRMMGFPDADAGLLKHWSGLFFYLFHAIPNDEILAEVNLALSEFRDYVQEQVEMRKRTPGDDLLSQLLNAGGGEEALSEQEVIDNVMLLTADGIENVQAGLSAAVYTLLGNPDQLQRMIEDRTLIGAAVDECLRYESPGQYQGRVVRETLEIGGQTIKAHSIVLLVLGSANRDPAVFSEPDRFVVGRAGPRHLAFGVGRHACIGGALVNMEFSAALGSLFDRSRAMLTLQPGVTWTSRAGHRWLSTLPLNCQWHTESVAN